MAQEETPPALDMLDLQKPRGGVFTIWNGAFPPANGYVCKKAIKRRAAVSALKSRQHYG